MPHNARRPHIMLGDWLNPFLATPRITAVHFSHLHYGPFPLPIVMIFGLLLIAVIAIIQLNVIRYAYERIGISRQAAFSLLLLSLVGSYVNIPVFEMRPQRVQSDVIVEDPWGFIRVVPEAEDRSRTVLAVNLGGAIVPTLLSAYLIVRNGLYFRSVVAVAIVAWIVHAMATPVQGVGITVPTFIPPIAAAIVAVLISRIPLPDPIYQDGPPPIMLAPALAYVAGSLGTLLGADLLNLDKIQGLGAPVASIGGAGTFDGIFVTGILAVLLA